MNNSYLKDRNVNGKAKDIVLMGLLISLVFVATMFINIRIPFSVHGGLIHLGSAMVVVITLIFGRKKGAISAAFGMSLFDLLIGGAQWAPFTFVIKGIMAYIIGTVAYSKGKKGSSTLLNITGIVLGGIWMIIGYYIAEVIIYGNFLSPITSIPGMVLQIAAAMIFGLPGAAALKKVTTFN